MGMLSDFFWNNWSDLLLEKGKKSKWKARAMLRSSESAWSTNTSCWSCIYRAGKHMENDFERGDESTTKASQEIERLAEKIYQLDASIWKPKLLILRSGCNNASKLWKLCIAKPTFSSLMSRLPHWRRRKSTSWWKFSRVGWWRKIDHLHHAQAQGNQRGCRSLHRDSCRSRHWRRDGRRRCRRKDGRNDGRKNQNDGRQSRGRSVKNGSRS